ncbi:hypothetical protein SAMN05421761_1272 [Belliella pelovolcani]|uniref:Uncharacterized protein n=1 Tax=Belliella pelovolcani TaxID=529505 RepID=A0A1N7Q360_9BACT|nr:hypothetical protein SAMN05421761_1272 [Belliella pelovolcani]
MKNFGLFQMFVLFLSFALLSCERESRAINKVRVTYLPEYTNVMVPVTCESIDFMLTFRDTKVISDKAFLTSLSKELQGLKANDSIRSIDIRIKILIDYSNKTDTLCLGEFFDTILNGNLMEDNPRLLDLIKSEIY